MKPIIFAGLGFELVGLILSALWVGPALENHFELRRGYATVFILVIVLFGWFYHLTILLRRLEKSDKES